MAIPPSQPPTVLSALLGFSAGGGSQVMPTPASVQTLPSATPAPPINASAIPNLIGVDVVSFSITAGQSNPAVTFPNLPYRNNTINALSSVSAAQSSIACSAISLFLFVAFVQGTTQFVSVTTQAIDLSGVVVPGPVLGADSYRTFQAVLSATGTGPVTGSVVGLLYLSNG